MSAWLPPGCSQSDIDRAGVNPYERLHESPCARWELCTPEQQDQIMADFLEGNGTDLLVELVEDGSMGRLEAKRQWREFRDDATADLLRAGRLNV
jgi:hypothetical protein